MLEMFISSVVVKIMTMPYYRASRSPSVPSWKSESVITIDNFGGGMNNVEADNVINDNECSDCKNMKFSSNVLMEKRSGCTEYDNVNYPALSEPIIWVDEYKPLLSESKFIRATETALYVDSEKICDVAGKIQGVNYIGKYYFVDGDKLRVYDGESVKEIITEPVGYLSEDFSSKIFETDNSGRPNGSWEYNYTMKFDELPVQLAVDCPVFILSSSIIWDEVPEDLPDIEGTVTAIDEENKSITINYVTEISGYRATVKKSQPVFFYKPLALDYVEGEVKSDENYIWYEPCLNQLADEYTGAGYIPKNPSILTIHKDRLFIAGDETQPHSIYMSWVSNPLWFPSNSHISVKPNGEEIVDLVVFDDALIIGRHEDMFVLYGSSVYPTSSDAFYIKQMDVSIGFMCKDCGALLNNFYIFLGYDGRFYKLNTPTTFVEYLMTRPLPRKIDLYSEPFNLSPSEELNLSTTAYYNEIYFNITDDLILVYNYDNMAWTYYTGMQSKSLYSDGMFVYIGRTDGKLVKYDVNGDIYNDLGEIIESTYATKRFDFNSPVNYKYFKSLLFTAHAYDEMLCEMNVNVEIDYFSNTEPYKIEANIPTFGIAKWGSSYFNNRNLYKTGWLSLDVRGRTIKFIITNTKVDEPMKIYDVNVLCTMRDVR